MFHRQEDHKTLRLGKIGLHDDVAFVSCARLLVAAAGRATFFRKEVIARVFGLLKREDWSSVVS